jgi:hypothetical protein
MPAKHSPSTPPPLPPASFPALVLHAASALHRALAVSRVFVPVLAAAARVHTQLAADCSRGETLLPARAMACATQGIAALNPNQYAAWDGMFFAVACAEVRARFHLLRCRDIPQILLLPLHLSAALRPVLSVPPAPLLALYASIASSCLALM